MSTKHEYAMNWPSRRVIPELNHSAYREIVYGPYRIMFKIENEDVWITGVVHGARDWKPEIQPDD